MAKSLKKIAGIIEWILFIAMMGIFVMVVSPLLPFENVPRTYVVVSGSMEPTIMTGSLIVTKPVVVDQLHDGQIVAFTSPQSPKDTIVHRIIDSSDKQKIKTKGDNNNAEDNWELAGENVKGEYVFAIPYLGHAGYFVRKPLGFFLMIFLPALVFVFYQILNIRSAIKEEIDRKVKEKIAGKTIAQKEASEKILSIGLIIVGTIAFATQATIKALYTDQATVSGITLSIADFVAPNAPQITAPVDQFKHQPANITVEWTAVEDYEQMNNPVYYNFQLLNAYDLHQYTAFPDLTGTSQNLVGMADGTYIARVEACDSLDNCSDWSNTRTYIVDSIAPPVPTLVSPTDQTGNSSQLVQKWQKATDNHGGEVSYLYESYDNAGLTQLRYSATLTNAANTDPANSNYILKHAENAPNGQVYWRVKAIDEVGNASAWSSVGHFTIDNSSTASITVSGSPLKDIENRIQNGEFESDLGQWQTSGEVSQTAQGMSGVSPHLGSGMAQVGDTASSGISTLTQTIDNSGRGLRTLGLWYKLVTAESAPGFDEPAFQITINGQVVYQQFAQSAQTPLSDHYRATDWQYLAIDLADFTQSTLRVEFSAGNMGDEQLASLVYLDQVTTNVAVVSATAQFTVTAQDPQQLVHYDYSTNGQDKSGERVGQVQFSLTGQPEGNQLEYWVEGENHQIIQVLFDDQAPTAIEDLTAINEGSGEYSLSFTAPTDNLFNTIREYDLRYSTQPITAETDWASLAIAQQKTDEVTHTFTSPLPGGAAEQLVLTQLQPNEFYYFAVKSRDDAHNLSPISNVAQANLVDSPVNINEVMYNPVGNDSGPWNEGEWVELYNQSQTEIDLTDWYLTDENNQKIIINSSHADTNLVTTDSGETTIPAHGWLTVFRNGSPLLNNTGDTISLFDDQDRRVSQLSYSGSHPEGKSWGRNTEQSDSWTDLVPTPSSANHTDEIDFIPQLKILSTDDNQLSFLIVDGQYFESGSYEIQYQHLVEGQPIREGIRGAIDRVESNRQLVTDIALATCSENGQVCVAHESVSDLSVEVTLKKGVEEYVLFLQTE